MSTQTNLENNFNPHRIFKLVKEHLCNTIETDSLSKVELETLVHLAIHIQMFPSHLLGLIGNKFPSYQQAADSLTKLINDDFMDYDLGTKKLVSCVILPSDLRNEISKQHYPLPMLSTPKPVTKNKGGGYHSIKLPLLLGSKLSRHNYPQSYDTINKLNSTPLLIRKDYINPDLVNPSNRKHEALAEWRRHHKQLVELSASLPNDSSVYLTHAYDKRGRIYCRGYHFSYQGDSYHKSLIEINKPEKLK